MFRLIRSIRLIGHSRPAQSLVEVLIVMGLSAIILPAILTGLVASREGQSQQLQRVEAASLSREAADAVRVIREQGWSSFSTNGTYHPVRSGNTWTLAPGSETMGVFTRSVVVSSVNRNSSGTIVTSGGVLDPSTKRVVVTVSWGTPIPASSSTTLYVTRYLDNLSYIQTTQAEFTAGTRSNIDITNASGGEIQLAVNTKAKWCSPEFSASTIDLPDGPPVAVAARSSTVSSANPNDIFVATSPSIGSSIKMAYLKVTANTETPTSTLNGKFTLDPAQFSAPAYIPTGLGLDNTFKTNDIAAYTSGSGKLYALIATDKPDREVVVAKIDDTDLQDPVAKIYKYHTFFNTRQYSTDTRSTPNQDQAPFAYGGVSVAVMGNRGYLASGGYLYVFDLSNIDSKTTSSGLDMVGCRIQLDGYDCSPGTGTNRKYNAGQTGASWSDTSTPAHNDCSDGGNIELFANNDLAPVQVGANNFIFVAVGAGTNPEFAIVNATSVPTGSSSPSLANSSCGRISGGNSGWRRISSLDFNSQSGTEEAANSVYAKSDGTRAYISSNGGIDSNGDNQPDSKQFYVINTTNKNSPAFLSGTPSTGATSGFYQGAGADGEMFPRRSLTVLNGERVVLVGSDGFANANDAREYQVLNSGSEASPSYCGGINFDQGFNDLTAVSEADGDNFVYMVANTTLNELKIIQGGPDGTYQASGTYESTTYDAGYDTAYNRLVASVSVPANTTLQAQVAVAQAVAGSCAAAAFNFIGPDGTSSTYFSPTGSTLSVTIPYGDYSPNYFNPGRCFRYKLFLTTTNYDQTPVITDVTVNYSP